MGFELLINNENGKNEKTIQSMLSKNCTIVKNIVLNKLILFVEGELTENEKKKLIERFNNKNIFDKIFCLKSFPYDKEGNVDKKVLMNLKLPNTNKSNLDESILYNASVNVSLQKDYQKLAITGTPFSDKSYNSLREVITEQRDSNKGITFTDLNGMKQTVTYHDLFLKSKKLGITLLNHGFHAKDKVIIIMDNNEDILVTFWACILQGIIPVMYTLSNSFKNNDFDLQTMISFCDKYKDFSVITDVKNLLHSVKNKVIILDKLNECSMKNNYVKDIQDTDNDICFMLLTSGSTTVPKLVPITNKMVMTHILSSKKVHQYKNNDRFLNIFPITHGVGLIEFHLLPLYLNCDQFILDTKYATCHLGILLKDYMSQEKITVTWGPNSFINMLNNVEEDIDELNLEPLRLCIVAGEIVNFDTCNTFVSKYNHFNFNNHALVPEWGMTETGCMSISSIHSELETININNSVYVNCGHCYPGLNVRIVDDKENIMYEGEEGRLQVKGDLLFPGYFTSDSNNTNTSEWFDTGDRAVMLDKNIFITGRNKNILIKNGKNYSSEAIASYVEKNKDVKKNYTSVFMLKNKIYLTFVPVKNKNKKELVDEIKKLVLEDVGLLIDYIIPLSEEDIERTGIGKIKIGKLKDKVIDGSFQNIIKSYNKEEGKQLLSNVICLDYNETLMKRPILIERHDKRVLFFSNFLISKNANNKLSEKVTDVLFYNRIDTDVLEQIKNLNIKVSVYLIFDCKSKINYENVCDLNGVHVVFFDGKFDMDIIKKEVNNTEQPDFVYYNDRYERFIWGSKLLEKNNSEINNIGILSGSDYLVERLKNYLGTELSITIFKKNLNISENEKKKNIKVKALSSTVDFSQYDMIFVDEEYYFKLKQQNELNTKVVLINNNINGKNGILNKIMAIKHPEVSILNIESSNLIYLLNYIQYLSNGINWVKQKVNKDRFLKQLRFYKENELVFVENKIHKDHNYNAIDKKLIKLCQNVLHNNEIDLESNFFAKGGHSLNAMSLLSQINNIFNINLSVSDIFEYPILKDLSKQIELCLSDNLKNESRNLKSENEVNFEQEQIYALERIQQHKGLFNITKAWIFQGNFDVQKFTNVLHTILKNHPICRSNYSMRGTKLIRKNNENRKLNDYVVYRDLEAVSNKDKAVKDVINNEINREFDLAQDPLTLFTILKLSSKKFVFIINQHHIISDGISFKLLVDEIMDAYNFNKFHEDIHVDQQIDSRLLKESQDYWKEELTHVKRLNLPLDTSTLCNNFDGQTYRVDIDHALLEKVKGFSQKECTTPFMIMLEAYTIFLNKLTGQTNISVGIPTANRNMKDAGKELGMFVNTLPLNVKINSFDSPLKCRADLKEKVISMYKYQNCSLMGLLDNNQIMGGASLSPLFQTTFNFLSEDYMLGLKDVSVKDYYIDHKIAKYPISINIIFNENDPYFDFEYNTDLLSKKTVEDWSSYYLNILNQLISNENQTIKMFDLLNENQKREILKINKNDSNYPKFERIESLLDSVCQDYKDQLAIVSGENKITYDELEKVSDFKAKKLQEYGVVPGSRVGIIDTNDIETIINMIATLKCEATYVPLNLDYPKELIDYVINDASINVILNGNKVKVLSIQTCDRSQYPAYIMYTSGTTGKPKGVIVPHKGVIRLVRNTNWFNFSPSINLLETSSKSFDCSVFEIWGTLLNGGTLYLTKKKNILNIEKLRGYVKQYKINVMWLTSPFFNQLIENDPTVFKGCKYLVVGGDVLSTTHVNKLSRLYPDITLLNGYGPTENTTFSTVYKVDSQIQYKNDIPIGKPISNSKVFILNNDMQIQPYNVPGEIYLAGDGLADGYVNNEESNKKSFINISVNGHDIRCYKSGDIAKIDRNNNIHFIGRKDNLIKLRGFRVSLNYICNSILNSHLVKECRVIPINNNTDVIAFIVPKENGDNILERIKHTVNKVLPTYMQPSRYFSMDKLPLTVNGKVDNKKLLEFYDKNQNLKSNNTSNRLNVSDKEKTIIDQYVSVTKNKNVDVDTSFFEIGGNSLLAISLASNLKQKGITVDPKLIFMYQTPRKLAQYISNDNKASKSGQQHLIKIVKGNPEKPSLFLMPPAGGAIFTYIQLCNYFDNDNIGNVYAVQLPGLYSDEPVNYMDYEQTVDYCYEQIKDKFRKTDVIGGHSLGGHLAFSVSQILEKKGISPRKLLILDTPPRLSEIQDETENSNVGLEDLKKFLLSMSVGKFLGVEVKDDDNLDTLKKRIVSKSKNDPRYSSLLNEKYLDKYLELQTHQVLMSREFKLNTDKINVPIFIIRTTSQPKNVYDLFTEWKEYSRKPINIRDFDANHVTMLIPPYVSKLAKIIENVIWEGSNI